MSKVLRWNPIDYNIINTPSFYGRELLLLSKKGVRADCWTSQFQGCWRSGRRPSNVRAWMDLPKENDASWEFSSALVDRCEDGLSAGERSVILYYELKTDKWIWADAEYNLETSRWILKDDTEILPGLVKGGVIVESQLNAAPVVSKLKTRTGVRFPIWG